MVKSRFVGSSPTPSATCLYAPVAQLDRASDCGSEGHRFKSCQAYQKLSKIVSIYINNTQPAGQRGIKVENIIVFLFTTKTGLFFVLSQLLPLILSYYQHWDVKNTILYYYLYSLIIVVGTAVLALFWQPKKPDTEKVIFNGEEAKRVGQGCNSLFIAGWFFPAIYISLSFLPLILSLPFSTTSIILSIYGGLTYVIAFYLAQKRTLASGITSGDIARTFTVLFAPYLRMRAVLWMATSYIASAGTISLIHPRLLLLIIAVTESLIYGLQNAPGAVPVEVKVVKD